MKPDGRLLVYTTFATELLEERDADMMRRHLGNVEANLDADRVEAAFGRARLKIERRNVIGTEWREFAEERDQTVSRALLRLSRTTPSSATTSSPNTVTTSTTTSKRTCTGRPFSSSASYGQSSTSAVANSRR